MALGVGHEHLFPKIMKKIVTLLIAFVIATCAWGQIICGIQSYPENLRPAFSVEMQSYVDNLMGKDNLSNNKKSITRRNAASATWNYPTSTPSTPFGGGTGTSANPYIISTAQHLANLAYMVNNGNSFSGYYFKMINDIILNENVLTEEGSLNSVNFKNWIPIGGQYCSTAKDGSAFRTINYGVFKGFFDGGGYVISGVYIDNSSYQIEGVFGYIQNSKISNVGIVDSYINSYRHVGGLVGIANNSEISYCYNSSTIIANSGWCAGGICSRVINSNVKCCFNTGVICGEWIAGIVAVGDRQSGKSNISYCYNIGTIKGTSYVAGIMYNDDISSVDHCYNIGIITGNSNYYAIAVSQSDCYYSSNCEASGSGTSMSISDFANGTVLSLIDPLGENFIQSEKGYPVLKEIGRETGLNKTITNPIAGTGTVKSTIPYSTDYKYSTTQMVYTPSELTSGKGTISKIAFNVANTGSNTPYELKIYMAHRTGRIADAASAIPSEDLTLVYSGTPTLASSTGWETINLTNPFEYDGKSYLAIVVCRKSSSTSGNSYYSTKQSSGWTLIRESDDDYNYGVVTGTAEFDATRNRPNIQFTKVVIEPTSISFANASETVFLGKTKTLTATINPENAHNKTITWSSSNTSVATVSSKGVVTAKSLGTATITAKTFNGKTATCTVYVKEPVTAITLSDLTATLWVGATKTITATATPSTASSTAVTWSSSNTSVATVSSYGVITARAAGTCTITCKAADGSGISKSCAVTVKQPVTSIALSVNDATIWVGKTKTIKATVNPTNASKTTVKWSSSDPLVATVSSKGVIKAVGKGTCIITCTAADGYGTTSTCEVTVKQQITSIDFGYETLSVTCGTTKTLAPKIYPSDASIQTLTWKSKNTGVAKVSSEGVLTAVAPGTAKIICTATDGFKKADTITVEVVPLKITDSKPAIAKGTYGAGGISYTRTITAGKYVAFCLPYAVNLCDYTDEFSKVYVPMGVALHKSNGTVMISLKKVSLTETISAGQPFVALAAKSGSVAVVNDVKVTVTSLAEPKGNKLEVYDLGTNFITYNPDIEVKITGNYAKITGLDNTSNFTFSTSGSMSKAATVSPYRLYVTKNDERSNAKISDIQFSFEEDETVTGIEDLKIANDESPVDDSPIYNLKGQRVNRANAQQKGVYIINGKKHIK